MKTQRACGESNISSHPRILLQPGWRLPNINLNRAQNFPIPLFLSRADVAPQYLHGISQYTVYNNSQTYELVWK